MPGDLRVVSEDWIAEYSLVSGELPSEPPQKEPEPAEVPWDSWLVEENDGQIPALQLLDPDLESRETTLPETNMIFSNRPVDLYGFSGWLKNLLDLRVSPNGKILVDVNGTSWKDWITDCIGERNAENFPIHGDGYCDTDPWKVLSANAGGNIRNIKEIIVQNGTKWCILELLDSNSPPEKLFENPDDPTDGWYCTDPRTGEKVKMQYRRYQRYFNVRTNRKKTSEIKWLTEGGINVSNDVGVEGGKGHETWPAFTNKPAAQRLLDMWLYPTLPASMFLYSESIIVEGDYIKRENGIPIMVTKYRFHGPDVYGYDDIRGNWYLLSKMLVRGSLEKRDGGNGYDWRCFTPSLIPNRRTCPAPDCGWLRP